MDRNFPICKLLACFHNQAIAMVLVARNILGTDSRASVKDESVKAKMLKIQVEVGTEEYSDVDNHFALGSFVEGAEFQHVGTIVDSNFDSSAVKDIS